MIEGKISVVPPVIKLETPKTVELTIVRDIERPCRVTIDPRKEREIKPYIDLLVDVPKDKAEKTLEKLPGLDIEIHCESPKDPCACHGFDCDLVEKIESYDWDKFWHKIGDKANMVFVSTRWVRGCGTHTRVYIWPSNRIVVSHDTIEWEGVHVIYINLEKLKEKIRKVLEEG